MQEESGELGPQIYSGRGGFLDLIYLYNIYGSPLGGPHSIRGVGKVASAALNRITGASL